VHAEAVEAASVNTEEAAEIEDEPVETDKEDKAVVVVPSCSSEETVAAATAPTRLTKVPKSVIFGKEDDPKRVTVQRKCLNPPSDQTEEMGLRRKSIECDLRIYLKSHDGARCSVRSSVFDSTSRRYRDPKANIPHSGVDSSSG
jgi:hypothetical protein